MKNRTKIFGVFFPFFILLVAAAATLRTIALVVDGYFNYRYSYFTVKSLPRIANILIVCAIILFIIYIIGGVRKLKLIPNFESPANYIPSALVSTALFFIIIHLLKTWKRASELSIFDTVLFLLMISTAALSIVYLIFNTFFIRTVSARRAGFGLCITIFFSLYLIYLFFDSTDTINSPIKTVDQLTYAFCAVFFLYEIRLSMGREIWKPYIIFGFISAALSAYSSIPAIIVFFVRKQIISNSIYESLLTFSVLVFIIAKLILTDKLIERKQSSFVQKLIENAEKRDAALNPVENQEIGGQEAAITEEIPDENQFSILDITPNSEESISESEEITEEETPNNQNTEENQ